MMQIVSLSDAITLQRGFDLPTSQRRQGKYPVVASTGTTTTHDKFKVKGPGVVIGRSGSIGGGQYVESDFWPLNTTLWVKDFKGNDEKFIYYTLKSLDFSSFNVGAAVPTLNRNHLSALNVRIPDVDKQKKIANILGSLDEKIELNRHMNETLEQLGQTLFRHYFVDNPEAKNWDEGTLGDIMNITMGQSPPGKSYNNNGDGVVFYQGRADFGLRYPNMRLFTTDPKRFAKVGDVLLTVRAPVGDVNQASERCCIGRGLAAISSRTGAVSFCYYYCHQLKADFLEYNSEGTVFGSINSKQLKALKLKIPPIGLVEKFENEAAVIDKTIMLNSYQVKTLVVLRDSLLPKLISGGIEV